MSIRNLFSASRKANSQQQESRKSARRNALRKRLLGHETLEDRRLLASDVLDDSNVTGHGTGVGEIYNFDAKSSFVSTELRALSNAFETYLASSQTTDLGTDQGTGQVSPGFISPVSNTMVIGDRVVVDFAGEDPQALAEQLASLGAEVTGMAGFMVSALVPLGQLDQLGTLSGTARTANATMAGTAVGATTSQGVASMNADDLERFLGFNGAGLDIGILSDSFNVLGGAAADVASGDLPGPGNPNGFLTPVNVVTEGPGGSSDEGRGMLQLVHDTAPGATLSFASAFFGQAAFAASITALTATSDIISDDIFYFEEPFMQDGVIAQAVDASTAAGVPYFSLANNHGRNSYEQVYRPSAAVPAGVAGALATAHDFDPGPGVDTIQNFTLAAGQSVNITFQWDDPFFSVSGGAGAATDMDIYLVNAAGTVVLASALDGNIGGDPTENFSYTAGGAPESLGLVIGRFSGPDPGFLKYINITNGGPAMGALEFDTLSGTAYGHANAANGMSVGAASFFSTPAFGTNPPVAEPFSSAGGIAIRFDTAGNAIAPTVRQKPDIVAPDGGNTTFFGTDIGGDADAFPNFFGTSAAAPHAAALAGLMLQANPAATPAMIYSALETTAIDMAAPGYDFDTGNGLVEGIGAMAALGGPYDVFLDAGADADDATPDVMEIIQDGAGNVDFIVNGTTVFTFPLTEIAGIFVDGSSDDDTLIVDHSMGLIAREISYDGMTGFDSLSITGTPIGGLGPAARETYVVGATEDAGTWVIDPNGNMGPGAGGAASGDEMIVTFTGLEPVDSDTVVPVFDVVYDAGDVDNITIENGGLLNGFDSIRVVDNAGTFETFRFANKATARLHLNDGADTARLNYTIAAAGLTALEVYGNGAGGVAGVIADDDAGDTFILLATPNSFDATSMFGDGGSDFLRHLPGDGGNLDGVQGNVSFDGGLGDDFIGVQDNNAPDADLVTLTNLQILGLAPADIDYVSTESVFFETTAFADTVDILSTMTGTTYLISGDGAGDTFTFGNQTADFSVNPDGSLASDGGTLDAILGDVLVTPDFNAGDGMPDIINVDDSGTVGLAGAASVTDIGATTFTSFLGSTFTAPTTRLAGFAPANIDYFHGDYSAGTFAGFPNGLDFLNVFASMGTDTIAVNETTAVNATRVDMHTGDDDATMTINGDGLSADNVFHGSAGTDNFVLNVTTNLGATSFVDLTSLEIHGDADATSTARDRLTINDAAATARDLRFDYLGTQGDLDILPGVGGGLGAGVEDIPVNVRTMETVIYNGDGANDDTITVAGTAGDDDLTVALRANDHAALVFLGGAPYLSTNPETIATSMPGMAGGGTGPDILLTGTNGLLSLDGDGNTGTAGLGDRAIVYAASENDLSTAGGAADPDYFGFGAGVLIPGFGVGDAYDTIEVNTVVAEGVRVTNNANGPLVDVRLAPGTFDQAGPAATNQRAALIVNGGDEAVPQPNGVADDFLALPSANFNIQVNGNLPGLALGPNGLPIGDRLTLNSPSSINVFSDKATPPLAMTTFGSDIFGIRDTSIEQVYLNPGNGQLNLIGDNNDPAVDQNDNFVVVGRNIDFPGDADAGVGEGTVVINGSTPRLFNDVTELNAFGDDQNPPPGTPSAGNDIDTLEITPYADDTPRGWGIDVSFNEGNPVGTDGDQVDLLIVHTSLFGGQVSEDIVIRPAGPDNGEVVITNGSFGTPIVDIDYVGNTDIIVLDDDGFLNDTDTLTLLGTNPDTPQVSGNDSFLVDFDATQTVSTPLVTVTDSASGAILYRLRGFTDPVGGVQSPIASVRFDMLAGNDSMTFFGPLNPNGFASGVDEASVAGGEGDDALVIDYTLPAGEWASGRLTYDGGAGSDSLSFVDAAQAAFGSVTYTPGPLPGDGQVDHTAGGSTGSIDFTNLEPVFDFTAAANLIVNADNAANAITYFTDNGVGTLGAITAGAGYADGIYLGVPLTGGTGAGARADITVAGGVVTGVNLVNDGSGYTIGDALSAADANLGGGGGAGFQIPVASFSGTVAIDGQEVLVFANKTNLTINGNGGSDEISLNNSTVPNGLTSITVNGGDPSTSSDSVEIIGTAADDTFAYTPNAVNGGTVVQGGAIAMTYNLAMVESLAIDAAGQVATDALTVTTTNATITPGTDPGTGIVDPVSATGAPLLSASYAGMETATVSGTTAVIQGTAENDTITVSAAGIVTVTNELGFNNSVDVSAFAAVVINALGGDDAITITPSALAISVIGGDNGDGSDTLTFNGTGGDVTLDLAAQTVTEAGLGAVSYTGVEHLNVNTGAGALLINGSAGSDSMEVTPTAGGGVLQANGDVPEIVFTAGGAVTVDPLGGNDTVVIHADAAANVFAVSDTAVTVDALSTINLTTANLEGLDVRGGEGNDIFNVVQSATVAISVLGGNPIGVTGDTLNLTPTGAVMFKSGAENDEGGFTAAGGAAISFDEIEALNVALGGAGGVATIMGTGGDDHITATGIAANTVEVQVNDGPVVTYTGATTITLQGKNGDDAIVIDPGLAALGVNFTVDGGSATAGSDILTVNGLVNVVDAFTYTPTTSDSGSVAIAGLSTVTFTDIEQLEIDGQNDDTVTADTLDLNTFNVDGTQVLTPGAHSDSGDVEFRDGGFLASTATPVAFQRLGAGGSLTFSDIGRPDSLIYRGTDLNDTFSVSATGQVLLNTQIAVNTPSINTLTLGGLAGDDTFNVVGNHNLPVIAIQGGDPDSGSDILNFTGSGVGAVTLDLEAQTVAEAGFAPVSYTGIETVNIDANAALAVVGTADNDVLDVTPLAVGNDGRFTHNLTSNTAFHYTAATSVSFDGGTGGEDTLNVLGDDGVDVVTSTASTVTVDGSTVTIGAGIENLGISTFAGNDDLDLVGLGLPAWIRTGDGNDNVDLDGFTASATVDLGAGDDFVDASGVADDNVQLTLLGGAGNDNLIGGDSPTGAALGDVLDGGEGNDRLEGGRGQDFFFGGAGSDQLVWVAGDGSDLMEGGDGEDEMLFVAMGGANRLELFGGGRFGATGNPAPNVFGPGTLENGARAIFSLNSAAQDAAAVFLNMGEIEHINVDAGAGADQIIINNQVDPLSANGSPIQLGSDLSFTSVSSIEVNLGAGDGDGDNVEFHGQQVGDNVTISDLAGDIDVAGFAYSLRISDAEVANDELFGHGQGGDDALHVEAGVQTTIGVTLAGGTGNDLLSGWFNNASGGDGNDTFVGAALALPLIQTMDGGDGDDSFDGNGGTNAIIGGGVSIGDTIHVPGTPGDDVIVVTLNPAGHLLATVNGVTTTYTDNAAGPITGASLERIRVEGGLGDDSLTVDSTNGAIPIAISYEGNQDFDSLTLTGGVATSDIYSPGPNPGQGLSEIVIGGVTQTVSFSGLEPVIDLVAGPLVVNANPADNAINYDQSPNNAAWGRVTIDLMESIEFSNKTTLTINALAGDDTISLNNPATPTGLTGITVNGGDPTSGSDVAIVSGTTGADAIDFAPTTDDDAVITGAGPVTITLATIESAVIDGQGGNLDTLTYTSPAGEDHITFSPGNEHSTGLITALREGAGPKALMPLSFTGIDNPGADALSFADVAAIRVDDLFVNGTANDDVFQLSSAGSVVVRAASNNVLVMPSIATPGVDHLTLNGLDGDDAFNVVGDHPFTDAFPKAALVVEGGSPDSGSDVLNFTGAGAAVTVDLGIQTVTEAGFAPVAYSGVETINVNAGGVGLDVVATAEDDDVTVTVLDANSGKVEHGYTMNRLGQPISAAAAPLVRYTNTGGNAVNVDLAAGEDTLNVVGNALAQTFEVDVTTNTVAIDDGPVVGNDGTVTYLNNESLGVFGLEGDDTFDVTPGQIPVFIDGGDPIGETAGDTINTNAGGAAVTFEAGPENDEGGILVAGSQRISYDHIEALGAINAMKALIIGTNGDDDITVIARDASTHALADGVQDFTVSLNDGPAILFVDTAELYIDALSGDDDIVLRTPAPNDASWDVDVYVSGGAPSDGALNEGDRLVLETPGNDTVIYTPTGSDTGTILIDDNNDGINDGVIPGGVDSLITIGQFNVVCPGLDYTSDPGGVELFEYDGEGADDSLTIVSPAGDDTIVHTPGEGMDEGALRVNTALAVHYQNLGAAAVLTVADTGGNDTLVVNGTASDDILSVAATSGAVTLTTPSATFLALNQTQVENLSLDGLDGNDQFVVNLSQPYASIGVFGGGPGNSDVLTVNGAAGVDEELTVDPGFARGQGTVTVVGGGVLAIPYLGVEHVLLDANDADNDDLIINDDAVDNQWTVNAGPIFGDRVQVNGRESIDYDDFNDVTLNNGFGTDRFDIHPTNLIGFDGAFTVNGDPAGGAEPVDDVLNIFGTSGDDVVTSTASVITTNGIEITAGANLIEVSVQTLAGNDNVTLALNLPGVRKLIDAGAGDDNVDASGMQDATIFGGLGDDIIVGSPIADLIYGGSGNDTISGLGGNDTIYGGDGNDTITGGTGDDNLFGGADSDLLIWNNGDNTDLMEGGTGNDRVQVNGAGAAAVGENYVISANGTRVQLQRTNLVPFTLDIAQVEQLDLNTDSSSDDSEVVTVNSLVGTELEVLNLDAGGDSNNQFILNGNDSAETISIGPNEQILGLGPVINTSAAVGGGFGDTITINAAGGADTITVTDAVNVDLVLNGGLGNDVIDASLQQAGLLLTINGDAGDDLLRGGAGDDTINGGAGEDTLVGGLGLDTFDGGSGFDTILVEGFASDDRVDLRQDNPTTLRHEVGNADNGFDGVLGGAGTETDTLVIATVEQVRITAGAGDDTIRVAHDDTLVAAGVAANVLRIDVHGGAPGASDRLTVIDDGAGDTNVQRLGQTDGDGSFTTYAFDGGNPANPIIALPPVIYTDVEYASLNPIGPVSGGTGADGSGRLFVFKYDPVEQNQSLPTATFLGAGAALNLDPNIDPGVDAVFGTPGDEDWYRVVAEKTGTLDFQVYFRQQGTLVNGRAGLPNAGNLDIAVFDADGLVNGVPLAIAGNGAFGANDANDDERVRIPAVAGQTYYLRVVGAALPAGDTPNASPAINVYNVSVVNAAPPTAFDLELADNLTILTGAQENPAVVTPANGTANFRYNAAANTFDLDLFVSGLELTDTTSQPEVIGAHIHTGAVGVNGPIIVPLSAGIAGWVQEPSGIRLTLTGAAFSGAAADIAALLAGNTYINVHSTANAGGEVRGQILVQNVLGVSDSGRSQFDNVTNDNTPTVLLRLDDAILLNDLPGNAAGVPGAIAPDELIGIPHNPSTAASPVGLAAGYRVAVFDETDTHNPVLLGFAQPIANLNGVYSFTFTTPLAEGSHFISTRVQMIDPADNDANNATLTPASGFGPRSASLEFVVDTPPPAVSFGDAAVLGDGLHPDSDSGDPAVPATFVDNITNDLTPTFFGRAEANAIVRLYVDVDGSDTITAADVLIGQTVAVPLDGTNQSPNGEWEITSTVSMNDPNRLGGLGVDGVRTILVQAEDLAGNLSADDLALQLDIFIDTRGPQVTDVFITGRQDFNLFTLKPETPEPTPRVDSLTINVQDLPARIAGFLYPAISNLPVAPNVLPVGLIRLVGDHSGVIALASVTFTSDGNLNLPGVQPLAPGDPATGFITLTFAEPLPDDRFTLTLDDGIIDPAGNALDGESNASEPIGTPFFRQPGFASGDGIPGGDFVARFTVDSRPEVGTWSQELVYVDINGNFVWDPQGEDNDATNRDFVMHFGSTTDAYFAGNFAANALPGADGVLGTADDVAINPNNVTSSGFDKLGAYGRFNNQYQFFLDTNDDGVGDTVGAMFFQVNVIPVAGNFFNSAADTAAVAAGQRPRDEIGGFDGQNWYLDVNGNNRIDAAERFVTELRGIPLVGDFNGDGNDDLATFNNETGVFQFDLDRNGTVDDTLTYFFSGFGEKPVAGDMNLDGVDDIALWLPNRDGQLPEAAGEFHFLISDNVPAFAALPAVPPAVNALPSAVFNAYSPAPLGNDLIAQFGDEFALPLLGNFDPPVGQSEPIDSSGWFTNLANSLDVDGNGSVEPYDALLVINGLNRGVTSAAPSQALRALGAFGGHFLDTDGDSSLTPFDALQVINELNRLSRASGHGEASPATAASYAAAVDSVFGEDDDDDAELWNWAETDTL